MDIRELVQKEEFERCVELQHTEWGWKDRDTVPVRSFVVASHVGGITLGAFDGDRIVGFLNTLPGVHLGRLYWYSRMLGIEQAYRGHGIGTALKRSQREHAIDRGIHLIQWTFDPLESQNAHLNLAKLGVISRRYYVDHYGITASRLQRGMESDRLLAEWWLDRPRVEVSGDIRRVWIPADIQVVKDHDLEEAIQLQQRIRAEFKQYFDAGYIVVDFERLSNGSEYILRPMAGTNFEN